MKQLLDYDEDQCIEYYTETNDGSITLETSLDVEPMLDRARTARNEKRYDLPAKEALHKYADLDPVTILKLMKKDLNVMRPDRLDWKKLFREIETNYPYCKVTNKKAWRP